VYIYGDNEIFVSLRDMREKKTKDESFDDAEIFDIHNEAPV
jgi:hypothetical protein